MPETHHCLALSPPVCHLQLLLKVQTTFEANWYTDMLIAQECGQPDRIVSTAPIRVRPHRQLSMLSMLLRVARWNDVQRAHLRCLRVCRQRRRRRACRSSVCMYCWRSPQSRRQRAAATVVPCPRSLPWCWTARGCPAAWCRRCCRARRTPVSRLLSCSLTCTHAGYLRRESLNQGSHCANSCQHAHCLTFDMAACLSCTGLAPSGTAQDALPPPQHSSSSAAKRSLVSCAAASRSMKESGPLRSGSLVLSAAKAAAAMSEAAPLLPMHPVSPVEVEYLPLLRHTLFWTRWQQRCSIREPR